MKSSKNFIGKVTVQTIDVQSGRIVQEAHTENFAANQTNEYGKWLQKSVIKAGLSSLGVSDPVYAPHTAANCIVLTDAVEAENAATEWYMYGATLGWASKATYAGTDIWRGTVNTTQLLADSTSVRWVFDWPTHAANGNIGSVGWVYSHSQTLSATAPEFRSTMTIRSSNASTGAWTRFAKASPSLAFGNTGNTIVYVLDSVYAQTTTFNVNGQFTAIRGLAWDSTNSFLWIIGDNGADRILAAYNSSGVLQTGPFTLTNRAYSLLVFDGTNLWSSTLVSGSTYTLWSLNPTDGSDLTNFNITLNTNNTLVGLAWDSNRSVFWTRNSSGSAIVTGIQAWDSTGNKRSIETALGGVTNQQAFTESNGSFNNNLRANQDFDIIDESQFAIPTSTTVHTCQADGLGTRARLSSPITKLNTQTLKVIYQINYV